MEAQTKVSSPVGEYYLRGVPETASGFNLANDSTFQFFFSQGALDRFGQGTWSIKNNQVVLNSKEKPGLDFALTASSQKDGKDIHISVKDQNENILRYVYCIVKGGGKTQEAMAKEDGTFQFEPQTIDSIELIFEFCPEKISIFPVTNKDHNFFEFKFEPWLFEIFFKDFKLSQAAGALTGPSPVLQGENFTYKRSGNE